MSKTIKTVLIVAIAILVVYFAYSFISNSDSDQSSSTGLVSTTGSVNTNDLPSNTVSSGQIGQEFLAQLGNLESISLTSSILSDPAYMALQSFQIILFQPGDHGVRANPFAPIGINSNFSIPTELPDFNPGSFGDESSGNDNSTNSSNDETLSDEEIDAEIQRLLEELEGQQNSN